MSDSHPEKRILKINPDLFSFSNNTTRKGGKREKPLGKIKLKQETREPRKNDTLKKKTLLKMIRNQQNNMYKSMFDSKPSQAPTIKQPDNISKFNSDFEEAQKYLENLTKEKENINRENKHNYTLKSHRPNSSTNSLLFENMNMNMNMTSSSLPQMAASLPMPMPMPVPVPLPRPEYGCLKNGSLPTYRNYMGNNKTQKMYPPPPMQMQMPRYTTNPIINNNHQHHDRNMEMNKTLDEILSKSPLEQKLDEELNRISEIRQTSERLKLNNYNGGKQRQMQMKQKRIKRRTYKIGKSKEAPQISILVSNRTIRNNVSTRSQLLKQVSIQEIKKYLIKRGFIKVGSTAPNDVLRKMYESAILIGGDVQNHNPENLLYNFIHSEKS